MVAPLEPGIVCADLEAMLRFYKEVLGFEMVSDAEASPEMSTQFGASPLGYRIVRLQTPYGERIKLVQTKALAKVERELPEWIFERHGLAYITFVVSDVDEVSTRLRANGIRFINKEPMEVRKGFHALFVTDPESNYVEFVQYADLASYRQDLQTTFRRM
jgi:catechol 2,3-dioxygenase-like lactoylglutathione lyase family enzyme